MLDNNGMESANNKDITFILSIGDAQTEVSQITRPISYDERDKLNAIAEYVLTNDNMYGDDNDYHNLASEYARHDDYFHAFRIVEKGLEQYPFNIDLLANAIRFGASCGEEEKCETYLSTALSRPYEMWNWRLFTFSIDYLKTALSWKKSIDDVKATFSKALSIAEQFQQTLPYDERGFNAAAELYLLNADRDNAKTILKRAIWGNKENAHLIAPQCCVTYINMLESEGDFEEIERVAIKGIEYTAQKQPSAQIGYFPFMYALAQDAIIHKNSLFGDKNKVNQAIKNYEIAQKTLTTNTLKQTANTRSLILAQMGDVEYVERSPVNAELLSLFKQLKSTEDDT